MSRRAKGWHREEIKAAIRMRGITLEQLSQDNGLDPRACSLALSRPHWAAEMVIAEYLGVSPRQIWPQRYDGEAYRHPKSREHHIRQGRGRECQKDVAA